MEFGRISYYARVNYRLPPTQARFRAGPRAVKEFQLDAGAPLWANPKWVGNFYPQGTPAREFLVQYSQRLPAVELSSTHYALPAPAQIQGWAATVPPGFHFYPKLPQQISHRLLPAGQIGEARKLAGQFFRTVEGLGENLGCTFLQLPPDFAGPNLLKALDAFTRGWPVGVPLAVEFRSAYCFEGGQLRPEFTELLSERGFGTVITDTPGRRDACHGTLTAPFAMIRFVGHELHETDYARVDQWVERIREWRSLGVHQVGFFVHQPEEVCAPELCDYLMRALNRTAGLGLTSWKDLAEPGQLKLF